MKKNLVLIFIIILAFALRFYELDSLPALNADEAAIGYNAFSLLQTGLDEHGNPWPIHFQSFNDYKPGLFFYIVLPFVKMFGLNVWAVRIPGALLGVGSIFAIWLLVRELFSERKYKLLADLTALFLAISPWHIHFSRGGWEVNAATFFIIWGVLFFLMGIKSSNFFAASVLFFVASLYTYHSARIIVPLLGLALLIIYRKNLSKHSDKKTFFGSGLLGVVLLIPLIINFIGPAGAARASGVSIFSDRGSIDRINEKRGQHGNLSSLSAKLIHNKPVVYTLAFAENYLDHFWGEFLFLSGDEIQRNKVPEFGLLYLYQFPLILITLYMIIKKEENSFGIILAWLVIAPIPASLTFQSPHALRAQSMVIPLTILSTYGLYSIVLFIKNLPSKFLHTTYYMILATIVVWDFSRYIHQYYIHMAKTYSFSSQYGVKEVVSYVNSRENEFEEIYMTDKYDQPYILYLFYSKYNPKIFQENHILSERDNFGFSTVKNFDKFKFQTINFDELRDKRKILIVGSDEEIVNEEANVVKTIYFPRGDVAFEIVEL